MPTGLLFLGVKRGTKVEIQGHRGQYTSQHVKFHTFSEVMPQRTSTSL